MIRNEDDPTHYLLTSLGTKPRTTIYGLDARQQTAEFAPVALIQLMTQQQRPDIVLCLLTAEARKTCWERFSREIAANGARAEAIDITDGDNTGEISDILDQAAERIEPGARLTIDITHGPRHIPIVLYALTLYLSSLREVNIEGAWYGKLETAADLKPLISLKPLLELPKWFHAVAAFREAGLTTALADQMTAISNELPSGPERGPPRRVSGALRDFASSYESGLPLELGHAAATLVTTLDRHPLKEMSGLELPLVFELGRLVQESARELQFSGNDLRSHERKLSRSAVELSKNELLRQAKIIDRYMERDQIALALGLMREWVVSLGIFHNGNRSKWLNRDERLHSERSIGALAQHSLKEHLDQTQKDWSGFWDKLCKQRNQIAHCGMRPETAKPSLKGIMEYWQKIRNAEHCWQPLGGGGGRVLVSPVGKSPGVLYSAIRKIEPDRLIVVCSHEARGGVEEAVRQTDFKGHIECQVMEDPFNGVEEIDRIRKDIRKQLLDADRVFVNLTGGTTLMGVAAQTLAEQARNDQRPCRRFVLIDKRPHEEQRSTPWVESALHWLDADSDIENTEEKTENG